MPTTLDVLINEIYASHSGTDNSEFIELFGTPGTSLDGWSLIVVEGDEGSSTGSIDQRFDFGADDMIGTNGYFLMGNPDGLVANFGVTPNYEFSSNTLENSSFTVALVETSTISGTSVAGGENVADALALMDSGANDVAIMPVQNIKRSGCHRMNLACCDVFHLPLTLDAIIRLDVVLVFQMLGRSLFANRVMQGIAKPVLGQQQATAFKGVALDVGSTAQNVGKGFDDHGAAPLLGLSVQIIPNPGQIQGAKISPNATPRRS